MLGAYDRFDALAAMGAHDYFVPPLRWLALNIGLPLACVQTGADLFHFAPADAAVACAPRPILFIHGLRDRAIPFELGQRLYDSALAPKSHLWINGNDADAANDLDIAATAHQFVETAVPML